MITGRVKKLYAKNSVNDSHYGEITVTKLGSKSPSKDKMERKGFRERVRSVVTRATRRANNIKRHIGVGVSSVVDIDELDGTLNQISQLISIAEPLTQNPKSPVALAKVFIGLSRFCIENPDPGDPEEYFRYEDRGWEEAFTGELAQIVFDAVHPKGELVRSSGGKSQGPVPPGKNADEQPTQQGAHVGFSSFLPDLQIGWMLGAFDKVSAIFLQESEMPQAKERLLLAASDAFWARRKTKHLVFRLKKGKYPSDDDVPGLIDDDSRDIHRSKVSDELVTGVAAYLAADVPWTYMLYGPPGSGKTTAAQRLIRDLQLRSLRLPVETLHRLEVDDLDVIFKVVRPEAVIMDDFDRSREQDALLERLEKMRREVKLVVATVNDPDDLEEAILRPGRIDEWVEVDRLDDDAIRNILGEYADDSFELVKNWPVAFIENYITRRRVRKMSAADAKSSLVELAARVKRMRRKQAKPLSFDDELNILAKDAKSSVNLDDTSPRRRPALPDNDEVDDDEVDDDYDPDADEDDDDFEE